MSRVYDYLLNFSQNGCQLLYAGIHTIS